MFTKPLILMILYFMGCFMKQSRKPKILTYVIKNASKKTRKPKDLIIQIIRNAEETGANDKTNTYILGPYNFFSRGLS